MKTNTSLTVYNKYYNPTSKQETYFRHVVEVDVLWEDTKRSDVIRSGGEEAAYQAKIYVPKYGVTLYLGRSAWEALVDKTTAWTLREGDIVVKGSVTDELTGGFTPSMLRAKYDSVLVIRSVDDYDFGGAALQHWRLGAR